MDADRRNGVPARSMRATGETLVVADGTVLVQLLAFGTPESRPRTAAQLPGGQAVSILVQSDQDSDLLAVTTGDRLLGWSFPLVDRELPLALDLTVDRPIGLLRSPVAATAGSFTRGVPQLVLVTTEGELFLLPRHDPGASTLLGICPQTVAVCTAASVGTESELYSVTREGRVSRWSRARLGASATTWSWNRSPDGQLETDADDVVVAMTCWSSMHGDDQVVVSASGRLHQRSRSAGSSAWSSWWVGPAVPADQVVAVVGWSRTDGSQSVAALDDTGHLYCRSWRSATADWQPWTSAFGSSPIPVADERSTERLTLAELDEPATAGDPEDAARTTRPETVAEHAAEADAAPTDEVDGTERAAEATRLFTGRDLPSLRPGDPDSIGPFTLLKRIEGGQASTDKFVARDNRGFCFLKVLKPDAGRDESAAFQRECRLSARLVGSRRLPSFIEARPEAGGDVPAYLALTFEEGRDLREITSSTPLDGVALIALARGLAEALTELETFGLHHVDIKPGNVIMRTGSYPILVDLGSAVESGTITVREAPFATPGYVAPEFSGQLAVGPTTDVFSWGAVVLAASTGRTPGPDATADVARLPVTLRELVVRALKDDPALRPSPQDLLKRLPRPKDEPHVVRVPPVGGLTASLLPARLQPSLDTLHSSLASLRPAFYRLGLIGALAAGVVAGLILGVILGTLAGGA